MQMLEEERKRKLALGQSSPTPDAGDSKPQSSSNSLFEDLPEPGIMATGNFAFVRIAGKKVGRYGIHEVKDKYALHHQEEEEKRDRDWRPR